MVLFYWLIHYILGLSQTLEVFRKERVKCNSNILKQYQIVVFFVPNNAVGSIKYDTYLRQKK